MGLTLGPTRIRVHPLAMMFPLAAAMLGAREEAAALVIGLCTHEGAHLLAARCLGVGVSQLRLLPFGGAIHLENPYALPASRLAAVAAAGPLGNGLALLASAALAHWGALSPALALALLRSNLILMLFNLLPALPLDGGRLLYALLAPRLSRHRAVEAGIWLGRALAVMLLGAALASLIRLGRFNLSYALAAVFLLAAAPEERAALSGARVEAVLAAMKPVLRPVPARVWAVSGSCAVRTALRVARPDALTLFAVYEDSRLASFTDDRRLLEAMLERSGDIAVGDAAGIPMPK